MAAATVFAGLVSREDVARLLGTSIDQILYLLYGRPASQRYKRFTIPKRRGGRRTILAPCDDLKHLQRKLASKLAELSSPRRVAYGFVKGRNIVDNASRHLRCRYVLNVDLSDFFPTITFRRVRGLFISLGASDDASTVLGQICCHNDALPQGAPTSPILSNMICAKLDRELLSLAKQHHCTYTRYADDLTFSKKTGSFPVELARLDEDDRRTILGKELRAIIEGNGFSPNPKKLWLFSRIFRQTVTGLVVNSKPNVRREWVRQLRAMIHDWKTHGLETAEVRHRREHRSVEMGPIPFAKVVRGRMEFLRMVKGSSDPVYRNLQRRLVEVDPEYLSVMQKENEKMLRRDAFISHASEDKEAVAKELADRLIGEGITVWYDEYSVRLGDDLLEKIDEGLVNSRFGVIVLSPNFFAAKKTWTRREYSGLIAGEDVEKQKRIIPVWHEISREELYKKSPTIANRLALLTSRMTPAEMAKKIAEHIRSDPSK